MDRNELIRTAHESAVAWARKLLARNPNTWTILDTETTGLDNKAQAVQVSIINGLGDILLNNVLIQPTFAIPADAIAVHHITNAMVRDASDFPIVFPLIREAVQGTLLCIYNAQYDLRILTQSGRAHRMGVPLGIEGYTCAMLEYAKWVGDWDDYHCSFRWQKLQGGDHSSLGDCRATLDLIHRVAMG